MVQVSYQNPKGKVLKNGLVQVDPHCAQTGVKFSLSTNVLSHTIVLSLLCNARQINFFSEIHDLILIPGDLRLTSDTILGDLNLIDMFM